MTDAQLRVLALVTAAFAVAVSVAAIVMFALTPGLDLLYGWGFAGYDALFSIVYVAVGLLIATRRPRNLIAWLFLASAVLSGLQTATGAYSRYAQSADPSGAAFAFWITNWIWIPAVGLIILTLLLYPDSRLPSPRWRWAAIALIPVTLVPTVLWALAPPPAAPGADLLEFDPLRLPADHFLREIAGPTLILITGFFIVAAASLRARMRRGDTVVRQQVKWIAFAAALLSLTLGGSVFASLSAPGHPLAKATEITAVFAVLLVPIFATVAILRYRLYDIDLIINRALVYVAVSALLVATYAAAVVVFQNVLRPITGGSEFAVALSTLTVAALFQPLRINVQRAVDRRFYRGRYDAARTLDRFSARLRDQVDLDSVRHDLVGVLHETVQPTHASVWLRDRS